MCKFLSDYKIKKVYEIEKEKNELKKRIKELDELEKKYIEEMKEKASPEKGKPEKDKYKNMCITVSAVTGSRRCNYNQLLKLSEEIYKKVVTQNKDTKAIKFNFEAV